MANIKIDIAKNGLTTLATAGKYCDRNVEIDVNVAGGGGGDLPEVEPIVLTGDQRYGCAGKLTNKCIELFGDTITTNSITDAEAMFSYYTGESIPFEINIMANFTTNLRDMFYNCNNLKELPKINNAKPSMMQNMFYNCHNLRNIPEDYFDNWDLSYLHTDSYASKNYMFYCCHSLRDIPQKILNELWGTGTTNTYVVYYYGMYQCFSLDEIKGMGIHQGSLTSNRFTSFCNYCARLKDLTFAVNEDGTPKTANWKSQTIDLSYHVGYTDGSITYNPSLYNSGITADKEVKDDATYQALKNDPDWYTYDINYSRYNHDSAVNTINSLPDCSATGTNTIKFKGASGAKTDGGAINTLTEAEIAVAAAKGWTVSLV